LFACDSERGGALAGIITVSGTWPCGRWVGRGAARRPGEGEQGHGGTRLMTTEVVHSPDRGWAACTKAAGRRELEALLDQGTCRRQGRARKLLRGVDQGNAATSRDSSAARAPGGNVDREHEVSTPAWVRGGRPPGPGSRFC